MKIVQRVITKQGHPVPKSAYGARGPFPAELFKEPEIIYDYDSEEDDVPIGGTAHNHFTAPKRFECRDCEMIVLEHEIPSHHCSEAEVENGEDA